MDELGKILYTVGLLTVGTTAAGFASKKALGTSLGTPETLNGSVKLGVAIGLGCFAVGFAQEKKWIPKPACMCKIKE